VATSGEGQVGLYFFVAGQIIVQGKSGHQLFVSVPGESQLPGTFVVNNTRTKLTILKKKEKVATKKSNDKKYINEML
jgi:hypothetical protein